MRALTKGTLCEGCPPVTSVSLLTFPTPSLSLMSPRLNLDHARIFFCHPVLLTLCRQSPAFSFLSGATSSAHCSLTGFMPTFGLGCLLFQTPALAIRSCPHLGVHFSRLPMDPRRAPHQPPLWLLCDSKSPHRSGVVHCLFQFCRWKSRPLPGL